MAKSEGDTVLKRHDLCFFSFSRLHTSIAFCGGKGCAKVLNGYPFLICLYTCLSIFPSNSQRVGCNNIHECVSEQQGKYGLVCQFQQPLQVVGGQDIVPGDGQKVC